MTALDVFHRIAATERELRVLREKIERRRTLAEGLSSAPMEADGGSRGSRDPSMRLLDYMGGIESLEARMDELQRQQVLDRACCIYLAEQLREELAGVLMRYYVERKTLMAIGTEMGYSLSQVKRLKSEAEQWCGAMEIVYWDGEHVPMVVYRGEKQINDLPAQR